MRGGWTGAALKEKRDTSGADGLLGVYRAPAVMHNCNLGCLGAVASVNHGQGEAHLAEPRDQKGGRSDL